MADPENVGERRARAGLPLMPRYVQQWNIKWDVKPEAGINKHINRYKVGVNFTYQLPFSSLAKSDYISLNAKSLSFYLSVGYQLK